MSVLRQQTNLKRWKRSMSYGYRWMAETVFSSIKRTFGEHVTARKFPYMVKEIFLKATLYNMFNRGYKALLQNVSRSRIRQIWRQYRNTMTVPILAKPGRPSRSITNEEISAVIGTYKEYPCSAVVLETILDNRHGIKIPLNRIHKILLY